MPAQYSIFRNGKMWFVDPTTGKLAPSLPLEKAEKPPVLSAQFRHIALFHGLVVSPIH
jgi:hypothetical protein